MRMRHTLGTALAVLIAFLSAAGQEKQEKKNKKDTPKAAETRKKLKEKVTVNWTDTRLDDAIDELKDQVKGLGVKLDTAGGVSRNLKISYKADKKVLSEVLDGMFKKNGYGYIVVSKEGDAYDGSLLVKQGRERGYPLGEEPTAVTNKTKDTEDTKAKEKDKAVAKEKSRSADKDKELKADDPEKAEQDAARKLKFAKTLADDGKKAKAKERLQELVEKFPTTKAAEEARELLKKLDD
jgi:hypothetical protein